MDFRLRSDIPGHSPQNEPAQAQPSSMSMETGCMVVGRDVVLSGEISSCADLMVEGTVKATLKDGYSVEITETGRFNGVLEVMNAVISGLFEGQLTVKNRLVLRPSAQIKGEIFYGMIEVHPGARIEGQLTALELPQEEVPVVEEPVQQQRNPQPQQKAQPQMQQPVANNISPLPPAAKAPQAQPAEEAAFDMGNIINRINGDDDGEGEKALPFRNVANG